MSELDIMKVDSGEDPDARAGGTAQCSSLPQVSHRSHTDLPSADLECMWWWDRCNDLAEF